MSLYARAPPRSLGARPQPRRDASTPTAALAGRSRRAAPSEERPQETRVSGYRCCGPYGPGAFTGQRIVVMKVVAIPPKPSPQGRAECTGVGQRLSSRRRDRLSSRRRDRVDIAARTAEHRPSLPAASVRSPTMGRAGCGDHGRIGSTTSELGRWDAVDPLASCEVAPRRRTHTQERVVARAHVPVRPWPPPELPRSP